MNEVNFKVNVSYGDGSMADTNNENHQLMMFILWGIFLPLIAAIGLVGNVLTMVVLWRKEMHSTTILYLRALVVTDTGILIGAVITLTPISCAHYLQGDALIYFKDSIYPHIHTPGYYIVMALQQCNVWITVSVSMERYIAICHPFRAVRLITRKKTYIVIFVIVIISCLYNIPHLYATKAVACPQTRTATPNQMPSGNTTAYNHTLGPNEPVESHAGKFVVTTQRPLAATAMTVTGTTSWPSYATSSGSCYEVINTAFGTSPSYTTYRTVLYSAIIYVVPFLALVILNSFLIKELMVMQSRRTGTNINEENEANLSLVLVLIVVVFIFCQTPGLVSQFDVIPLHFFYSWLAVSNLLFATNSAVNFLIYTAFGRKFRTVLLRVFRHFYRKTSKGQNGCRASQYTYNGYEMSALASSNESKPTGPTNKHNRDGVYSNERQTECVPLTDVDLSECPDVASESVGCGNGHTKT